MSILTFFTNLFAGIGEFLKYLAQRALLDAGKAEAANAINEQALEDHRAADVIDAAPDVSDPVDLLGRLREDGRGAESNLGPGDPDDGQRG